VTLHTETIGDMTVIECEGRLVRSDSAFQLHKAVTSQPGARIVVLDLTELSTIEGGGLGMLCFLQSWAKDHDIQLKVFNPTYSVQNRLENSSTLAKFNIATLQEMMALLEGAQNQLALAA
jgi:anti-anti-sigma regulatory factor